MALPQFTATLAFFMILACANMELVWSISFKGSVSCVDCSSNYDYSGIKVIVKCEQVSQLSMAMTSKDGSFEAELPMTPHSPANCRSRLLGGPKQMYALNKDTVSKMIRVGEQYSTTNTLTFASSCSTLNKPEKCPSPLGSSKTVNFPGFPFAMPPTGFFPYPFLPIIGIP